MLRQPSRLLAVPPAARALSAQLLAAALALGMPFALPPLERALLQGGLAAALGYGLGLAPWWLPMQAVFAPLAWFTAELQLPPHWFLAGFLMLAALYWGAPRGQVPLYLSNRAARQAVAKLLPRGRPFAFLDLGCGFGGMLTRLAKLRGDGRFVGVELAPLPYLISRLRAGLCRGACRVAWGSLWHHDLAPYDVVYAYLSPVPMAALWQKAGREMRPGSLLISNAFGVPGVAPDFSVPLEDGSGGVLHAWRMPGAERC